MDDRALQALTDRIAERAADKLNPTLLTMLIEEIERTAVDQGYSGRRFIRAVRSGAFDPAIDDAITSL